jgi:hypothetical protein
MPLFDYPIGLFLSDAVLHLQPFLFWIPPGLYPYMVPRFLKIDYPFRLHDHFHRNAPHIGCVFLYIFQKPIKHRSIHMLIFGVHGLLEGFINGCIELGFSIQKRQKFWLLPPYQGYEDNYTRIMELSSIILRISAVDQELV